MAAVGEHGLTAPSPTPAREALGDKRVCRRLRSEIETRGTCCHEPTGRDGRGDNRQVALCHMMLSHAAQSLGPQLLRNVSELRLSGSETKSCWHFILSLIEHSVEITWGGVDSLPVCGAA